MTSLQVNSTTFVTKNGIVSVQFNCFEQAKTHAFCYHPDEGCQMKKKKLHNAKIENFAPKENEKAADLHSSPSWAAWIFWNPPYRQVNYACLFVVPLFFHQH